MLPIILILLLTTGCNNLLGPSGSSKVIAVVQSSWDAELGQSKAGIYSLDGKLLKDIYSGPIRIHHISPYPGHDRLLIWGYDRSAQSQYGSGTYGLYKYGVQTEVLTLLVIDSNPGLNLIHSDVSFDPEGNYFLCSVGAYSSQVYDFRPVNGKLTYEAFNSSSELDFNQQSAYPIVSSDGTFVIYARENEVIKVDIHTGTETVIIGPDDMSYWHRRYSLHPNDQDLYVKTPEGIDVVSLKDRYSKSLGLNLNISTFQIAPNGKFIVILARDIGVTEWMYDLYRVNSDGTKLTRLSEPARFYGGLRISPDSQTILVNSNIYSERQSILIDADGKNPRPYISNLQSSYYVAEFIWY